MFDCSRILKLKSVVTTAFFFVNSIAISATVPVKLPSDCPRDFAGLRTAMVADIDRRLEEMRGIFGSELRPATEFVVNWSARGEEYFGRYLDFDVSHIGLQSDHGLLLVKTRGEEPHSFVLDARLPIAKKIIDSSIVPLPPPKFSLSSDGKYFVEKRAGMTSDYQVPAEIGVRRVEGKLAWPTAETMNETYGLKPGAPMRFVPVTNTLTMESMQTYFNMELMERLASGEIPVLMSADYAKNVWTAHALFKFSQKPAWPQIQKLIREALDVAQDANRTARDRYQAEEQLRGLQYEIWHGSWNGDRPFWNGTSLPIRLSRAEETISQLTAGPVFTEASFALPPPAQTEKMGLVAKIKNWLPAGRPPKASAASVSDIKKPWLTRYREGGTAHFTQPLVMSPKDVALFLDDSVVKTAVDSRRNELDYLVWLKSEITHDSDSSGHSILGEGIQLKLWFYRHFPELADLSPPPGMPDEDRAVWFASAIEAKTGKGIRMPRVPLQDRDAYQSESIKRYFSGIFQDAFSNARWQRGPGGASPSAADSSAAYRTLGLQEGATEDEVKRAYRKQISALHPDKTNFDKTAEEKVKELNLAYGILSGKTGRQNTGD